MPKQVQGNVAEHGDVLGGATGPDTTLVFMKTDIEDPMNAVLNPPMTADRLTKGGSREGATEQVEAVLARLFLTHASFSVDHPIRL